jgi:hypothetical protein
MIGYRFLPPAEEEMTEAALFYAPHPDAIVIVAVAHQRRRPNYWQDRVS